MTTQAEDWGKLGYLRAAEHRAHLLGRHWLNQTSKQRNNREEWTPTHGEISSLPWRSDLKGVHPSGKKKGEITHPPLPDVSANHNC